jgi:hypothetical protein
MEEDGIFYGHLVHFTVLRFYGHLVQFVVIWYIFPGFGILYKEKSGNPVLLVQMRRCLEHNFKHSRSSFN